MSELKKLTTSYQRVAWLLDKVPAAQSNYKLLMLLYWQIFDDINISEETINSIVERGTEPETINRAKRKVIEENSASDKLEERVMKIIEEFNSPNSSNKEAP